VIFGAVPPRIYIATRPIDFRKGIDGLAAVVLETLRLDPFLCVG
jgi:transposase